MAGTNPSASQSQTLCTGNVCIDMATCESLLRQTYTPLTTGQNYAAWFLLWQFLVPGTNSEHILNRGEQVFLTVGESRIIDGTEQILSARLSWFWLLFSSKGLHKWHDERYFKWSCNYLIYLKLFVCIESIRDWNVIHFRPLSHRLLPGWYCRDGGE